MFTGSRTVHSVQKMERLMTRITGLPILGLAILVAAASSVWAQNQYIGYVFPAGGQQGTTFQIRFGGQRLAHACGAVVTGEGVSARLVDHYRVMNNQELAMLRQQLRELKTFRELNSR